MKNTNGFFTIKLLFQSIPLMQMVFGAGAATLTVTTTNDSGAGSLRQLIQNATPGDTITFSVSGEIRLLSGELLITNNNLTIAGPGATNLAVSGAFAGRVLEVSSSATVSLSGLTIRMGHTSDGAYPGGNAQPGGGCYNAGTLIMSACAISGNSTGRGAYGSQAQGSNGGPGGAGGSGGGIYNEGNLTLNGCTLTGNSTGAGGEGGSAGLGFNGGDGGNGGDGAGICHSSTNLLTLTNCTIGGNNGGGGALGGIYYYPFRASPGRGGSGSGLFVRFGTAVLQSVTLARNSSEGYVGYSAITAGIASAGGTVTILNTLVARNTVFGNSTWPPDVRGSFVSQGYNLIGITNDSSGWLSGDLTGASATPLDPKLGDLQDNGGQTTTMALLPGSPAINTGDDALLAVPFNLPADQRGLPRKSGAHVDIGAFERQALLITGLTRSGTDMRIDFIAEVGANYRLERKDNLGPGLWTTVADNLAGTGSVEQLIDSGAANQPQRFYRARTVP